MKVAIYARVSTDKQTKSVSQQLEQCRDLAQRQGYTVVAEYSDDGISGDKVEERTEFVRLLADAKAKKFKRVLAWDADRLGRTDSMTAAEMLNPLRKVGIKFELVKQGEVDLATPGGRMLFAIMQEQRHKMLLDTSSAILRGQAGKAKAASGFYGGSVPYGYVGHTVFKGNHRHTTITPCETTGPVVLRMFKKYAEPNTSLRAVVDMLNDEHIPSPRGGKWGRSTVNRILTHPIYSGVYRWGLRSKGVYYKRSGSQIVPKEAGEAPSFSEPIVHHDALPSVVPKKLWEAAQQKLIDRQIATRPRATTKALSGLIVCKECEKNMHSAVTFFRCNTKGCIGARVEERKLLQALSSVITEELLSKDKMPQRKREFEKWIRQNRKKDTGDTRRKMLEKRLDARQQKVAAGASRLLSVPESLVGDATAALEKLKAEQAAVARQLAELPVSCDNMTDRQKDKTYLQAVREVGKKLTKGMPGQINSALCAVGISLEMDNKKDAVSILISPDGPTCPQRNSFWTISTAEHLHLDNQRRCQTQARPLVLSPVRTI